MEFNFKSNLFIHGLHRFRGISRILLKESAKIRLIHEIRVQKVFIANEL